MTVKKVLNHINEYAASKGYGFEKHLFENLYLCLKAKPFVILSGPDGCGKYTLAKLFCESIGIDAKCGRFKFVSISSGMKNSSKFLGFKDADGNFNPGEVMLFWEKALHDKDNPYVLFLDDINISRTEDYLGEILKTLDTRYFENDGSIVSEPLFSDDFFEKEADRERFSDFVFPQNLYIIGSMNKNDSYYIPSIKIIDRANIIDMGTCELDKFFMPQSSDPKVQIVTNEFLKTKYLTSIDCADTEYMKSKSVILKNISNFLRYIAKDIGYRTRDEILFYLLLNKEFDLLGDDEALDNSLLQRIIPRIEGRGSNIKTILEMIFKTCVPRGADDYSSNSLKMFRAMSSPKCVYKKTAEKITFMTRRFEESGYCSFWNC